MKILLTGGAGYIGSHTAVSLTEAGHQVVLYDNFSNSRPDVTQRLERIIGRSFVLVEGNVLDTPRLIAALELHKISAVIHFAGLKAVGESVVKPFEYYANNVQGTICLLQAMRAVKIDTIVFSSSATVYGDPKYLPIDEGHATNATNPYGRTKLHIEEMLADMAAADASWRIACLRYFNPVGAHNSGIIGEYPNETPNNLMPYVAQVAIGKRPYLQVFGNDYPTPDGTGVRDYIHIMDLAEGHLAALRFLDNHIGIHIVNLGTGRGYTVMEMVKAFEISSGKAVPFQMAPRRPGDVAACYANADKAASQFGWTASRTLDDMCLSTWLFQQKLAG